MIDISDIVTDRVRSAVRAVKRTATVIKGLIEDPTSIPCTFIREMDNRTYKKSETDSGENHAVLVYEINTFGSIADGASVQAAIDAEMQNMKFERSFSKTIPNADNTLCRVIARYTAIVEAGKTANGETVYQMYRR